MIDRPDTSVCSASPPSDLGPDTIQEARLRGYKDANSLFTGFGAISSSALYELCPYRTFNGAAYMVHSPLLDDAYFAGVDDFEKELQAEAERNSR